MTNICYFLLGSNSSDKQEKLSDSIVLIEERIGKVIAKSSVYKASSWGYYSVNKYLNQALCVEATLSPSEVLEVSQKIEFDLGRTHKTVNKVYSDRPIDIDIIFYNDEVVDSPELTIPHPLMQERRYVLLPLIEIAPDFQHPVFEKTNTELLEVCIDKLKVVRLT